MQYFAISKQDGIKEKLTREEWAEKIQKGEDKRGLLKLLETGGSINHSNKYETNFYIYEVKR